MKRLTVFWQKYGNGLLAALHEFVEAVGEQRLADDAADTTFDRFMAKDLDTVAFTAPARLKFPSMFTSETYLRQGDRADWQNVHLDVQFFAATLIEAARKQGIPLYAHSAFRTAKEQNHLVAKGRSKATYPRAAHCQGKAVDIVHSRFHWQLTKDEWALLGVIGKKTAERMGLDVTWGGDWDFYDPAHWELTGWKDEIQTHPEGTAIRKTPRAILRRS